jgi:hypothetical protein
VQKPAILCLALLMFWVPAYPFTAAQDGGWRVESVTPLSEFVEGITYRVFPSPDGHRFVYEKASDSASDPDLICVLDIHTRDERCADIPRPVQGRVGSDDFFPIGSWSPDSTLFAWVGLPFHRFYDTDLSIADFTVPVLVTISDDDFEGNLYPYEGAAGASVEMQPVWSPDGKLIAVERTRIGNDGLAPSTITLFDLETGDIRDLIALPGHKPDTVNTNSLLGMDWSPDGSTLAVSLRHREMDQTDDGIWLVDVTTGQTEHLVTVAAAESALQSIFPEEALLAAAPVLWSPDGTRLLFWAVDLGAVGWCFWIDLDTREIAPVLLPSHPEDQGNRRMIWSHQAAWSPDGSMLLVATRQLSIPSDEPWMPLYSDTEEGGGMALHLVDPASGESTLLGHLPFEPAPLFRAAWGPDGDVIIAGCYLRLLPSSG